MKYAKYLLLLLLIAFIGSAIYVAVQPNELKLTKTKTIQAPQEVVYNYVEDLKTWQDWSPWPKTDPTDTLGNSNSYTWLDNNKLGTIIKLNSSKPSGLQQTVSFPDYPKTELDWTFEPTGKRTTQVTWTFTSKNIPFKQKALYALFGSPDVELAPKFENSLTKLDTAVVQSMKTFSITKDGITHHSGGYYLYKTASSKLDRFHDKIEQLMPEVDNYIKNNHIAMAGSPYIFYHKWDTVNNAVIFSYCIPTSTQVISTKEDILTGLLEPFRTVKTTLKGDYEFLDRAWEATFNDMKSNGLMPLENGPMLETYVTNPDVVVNPANWITELYVAIKEEDSIPNFNLP